MSVHKLSGQVETEAGETPGGQEFPNVISFFTSMIELKIPVLPFIVDYNI